LLPVINYLAMVAFSCLPTVRTKAPTDDFASAPALRPGAMFQAACIGALCGWPFGLSLMFFKTTKLPVVYGGAVFLAIPFVMGFAANWVYGSAFLECI